MPSGPDPGLEALCHSPDGGFHAGRSSPCRAPEVPVTTNLMGTYPELDYWKLAPHLDLASWDSYPCWHEDRSSTRFPWDPGSRLGDRRGHGILPRPRAIPETGEAVPADGERAHVQQLAPRSEAETPGVHALASLQAVAHGSDSVQYFQWRKSRGGPEKFHGAVIDHSGTDKTRVFREVAELGQLLEALGDVAGTSAPVETAIIFDWENRGALECASITSAVGDGSYEASCKVHHRALWAQGIPTERCRHGAGSVSLPTLVAPMLYMIRPWCFATPRGVRSRGRNACHDQSDRACR